MIFSAIAFLLIIVSHHGGTEAATDSYYTAAVYEHSRFGSSNDSAQLIIQTNLKYYKRVAEIAKTKDVDIIVFPEYGIFPPTERKQLKAFLEYIPDPRKNHIPCDDPQMYSSRPILFTLSCMAKNNSMYVVANTGDTQNCQGQSQCPPDGVFQFNTNVVFDRKGKLILKYHKEHLFWESGMDIGQSFQDATFETDFGSFATYICFDIVWPRMGQVARFPNISGIAFSTMWADQAPQWDSVQLWESWAVGNNATILASNIQLPGYSSVGSGIVDGLYGPVAYTFDPDGISKLVVARLPKKGFTLKEPLSSVTAITLDKSWDWKDDEKNVKLECSRLLLNDSTDIYTDYRCLEERTSNYTFVQLTKLSGSIEACNNGMCCSLIYSTNNLKDNFFLGVYNGSQTIFDRYHWCEENCVLTVCDAFGDKPCATFPRKSDTVFQHIALRANFTTSSVYPTMVESGMRLIPREEQKYKLHHGSANTGIVHFYNPVGRKVLSAGLKGRCYDRDPPYIR